MTLGRSTILGIALTERRITCAQVRLNGGKPTVQHAAHFDPPADVSIQQPEALGKALGTFLKTARFTASVAIIGVPARWLIAQERELPPSTPEEGFSVLRLQAERMALADNKRLVFDVVGRSDPGSARRVLLVGMLQEQLDRIVRMCTAARLKPRAVTSSALAVAVNLEPRHDGWLVLVSGQGAEVVARRHGEPRFFKHLPLVHAAATPDQSVQALGAELRRMLTMLGSHEGGGVLLWDEIGLTRGHVSDLSDRVGRHVRVASVPGQGAGEIDPAAVNGNAPEVNPRSYLTAVALARLAEHRSSRPPVDFLHSRLAPPPKRRIGRPTLLGIIAGALVLILGVSLYVNIRGLESQAAFLNQRLAEMQPDLVAAQARIHRTNHARGYYEARPAVLDCLKELALAFGPADPIWATSVTLRENQRGQIQGRAADQRIVLTVRDRLMGHPRFADVQLQDLREAGGNSREIAFSISFRFLEPGGPR